MSQRPLRSVLYVPGDNERALAKAPTLAVDAVILDLEDAVAAAAKDDARSRVGRLIAGGDFGHRLRVVRINDPDTAVGERDLAAVVAAAPDAVLIPKARRADDLARHIMAIEALDLPAGAKPPEVWAMIETPLALIEVDAIAELATFDPRRLTTLVFGSNDLLLATGVRAGPRRAHLVPWMMNCVLAAKAYGLQVLDAVYNDFADTEGLAEECRQARDMGFDGKTLIHPGQIGACNDAFTPSASELRAAQAIVDAFAEPQNAGQGVIVLEGRMIEQLHLVAARRILQLSRAINNNNGGD